MVKVLCFTTGIGVLLSGTPERVAPHDFSEKSQGLCYKELPWEMERLALAYPDFIAAVDADTIRWQDGTVMYWREGGERLLSLFRTPPSYEKLLRVHPTRVFREEAIRDWFDPTNKGRITYLQIFMKMYGIDANAVWNNMRVVRFMPRTLNQRLRFSTINGAADALEAVGRELDALPAYFHRYLRRSSTYVDRRIAGTQLRSLHSLGIAIDINPRFGSFWRWDWEHSETDTFTPRNRIPRRIVEIFERHGFLWGGRWYLYDTLHFEFRPDVFLLPLNERQFEPE